MCGMLLRSSGAAQQTGRHEVPPTCLPLDGSFEPSFHCIKNIPQYHIIYDEQQHGASETVDSSIHPENTPECLTLLLQGESTDGGICTDIAKLKGIIPQNRWSGVNTQSWWAPQQCQGALVTCQGKFPETRSAGEKTLWKSSPNQTRQQKIA